MIRSKLENMKPSEFYSLLEKWGVIYPDLKLILAIFIYGVSWKPHKNGVINSIGSLQLDEESFIKLIDYMSNSIRSQETAVLKHKFYTDLFNNNKKLSQLRAQGKKLNLEDPNFVHPKYKPVNEQGTLHIITAASEKDPDILGLYHVDIRSSWVNEIKTVRISIHSLSSFLSTLPILFSKISDLNYLQKTTAINIILNNNVYLFSGYSWATVVKEFNKTEINLSGGDIKRRHILSMSSARLFHVLLYLFGWSHNFSGMLNDPLLWTKDEKESTKNKYNKN